MPLQAARYGPAMKFNTAPTRAAHGYRSRAIWATLVTNSRMWKTIRADITRLGFLTSGIRAGGNTTATKWAGVKTHHVAVAAMHRLAAAALAALMLAWMVAGALAYFDVLVA